MMHFRRTPQQFGDSGFICQRFGQSEALGEDFESFVVATLLLIYGANSFTGSNAGFAIVDLLCYLQRFFETRQGSTEIALELIGHAKIEQHVGLLETVVDAAGQLQTLLKEIDGFAIVPLAEIEDAQAVANSCG